MKQKRMPFHIQDMGLTPKLAFSIWMSVQLCLEPAPSGVAMCHHPKLSIPCHSEQFVSWAQHQSTHTGILMCEFCSFSLLPHHLSQASPNCVHSFPSHLCSPSLMSFPQWEMETCKVLGRDSGKGAHVTAALCWGVRGGEAAGSWCHHGLWPNIDGFSYSAGFRMT